MITLYNLELDPIAITDDYTSAIWGMHYIDVAECEVEFPYSDSLSETLKSAAFIFDDKYRTSGTEDTIYLMYLIEAVETIEDDSGKTLRVTGRDLKALLEWRVTVPPYIVKEPITARDASREVVRRNLTFTSGSSQYEARRMPISGWLTTDKVISNVDIPRGSTVLATLQAIARAAGVGFQVCYRHVFSNKGFSISEFRSRDMTDKFRLSYLFGDVVAESWGVSKWQDETTAYVLESGENGQIIEVTDDMTISGMRRRETAVASEIVLVNNDYSIGEARRLMLRSGRRAINASKNREYYDYQATASNEFTISMSAISDKYTLGDYVQVEPMQGVLLDAQIVGATISSSAEGDCVFLTLQERKDTSESVDTFSRFPTARSFKAAVRTLCPTENIVGFKPFWRMPVIDGYETPAEVQDGKPPIDINTATGGSPLYIWLKPIKSGYDSAAARYELCWYSSANKVLLPYNSNSMFAGDVTGSFSRLETVDMAGLDFSEVRQMSQMFSGCKSLMKVDLSAAEFATAQIDASMMLSGCRRLTSVKIAEGNFSALGMLNRAGADVGLREVELSGKFDTGGAFFEGCFKEKGALTTLDLSRCDFSAATNINKMFADAEQVRTILWNPDKPLVQGSITVATDVFANCVNLVGGNGTKWTAAQASNKAYARIDEAGAAGYFTAPPTT